MPCAAAQRCVEALLRLYAFRQDDAAASDLPLLDGRWGDDLFNPETLKQLGVKIGGMAECRGRCRRRPDGRRHHPRRRGAAWRGGGAARHYGNRLLGKLKGQRELSVDDAVLRLLALRQRQLLAVLATRGTPPPRRSAWPRRRIRAGARRCKPCNAVARIPSGPRSTPAPACRTASARRRWTNCRPNCEADQLPLHHAAHTGTDRRIAGRAARWRPMPRVHSVASMISNPPSPSAPAAHPETGDDRAEQRFEPISSDTRVALRAPARGSARTWRTAWRIAPDTACRTRSPAPPAAPAVRPAATRRAGCSPPQRLHSAPRQRQCRDFPAGRRSPGQADQHRAQQRGGQHQRIAEIERQLRPAGQQPDARQRQRAGEEQRCAAGAAAAIP